MSFIEVIGVSPFHVVFPCLLPARYNIARLSLGWSKFLSSPVRVPIGSKTLLKKILFTAHYRQAIFCVASRLIS
jgi:hypothetical protein